MPNAKRDQNRVPTTLGLSEDGVTLLDFKINPTNGNLKVTNAGGGPSLYYLSPIYSNTTSLGSNTIGTFYINIQGRLVLDATYNDAVATLNTAGYLQYFSLHLQANSSTIASPITLFKNGVATAITITIPTGISGVFTLTSQSVTVSAGDTFAYELVRSDVGGISINYIGIWYGTTDGTSRTGVNGISDNNSSTILHHRFSGFATGVSVINFNQRTYFPEAGTIKSYTFNVPSNAKTTNTTFNLQIDDVPTAFSVVVPGLITGTFTVTVNTPVVAGDWCHFTSLNATSGTNVIAIRGAGFEFTTGVTGRIQTFAGIPSGSVVFNSTSRGNYGMPAGAAQAFASLARVAILPPVGITIVRGFTMVAGNTLDGNTELDLRVGATQYIPVTVPALTTNTTYNNTISQAVPANTQISMGVNTALSTVGAIFPYAQMTYTVAGVTYP